MQFGNMHFMWLLVVLPLCALFYLWAFKRKHQLIDTFVSARLRARLLEGVSFERQRLKAVLVLAALGLLIGALLRPKYGFHWEEVQRRGVDIVIALDVSKSMLAEDISPNRLERAKREIIDLLGLVNGDRIGLVAFAGAGFLQCPLTMDYGAVQLFLDDFTADLIPVPGTALGEAISKAVSAFDSNDKQSRAIILISDGEDHVGRPLEEAAKAKEQGVRIYTIGIGKEGGAPIPDQEHGGFMKNSQGEVILSKLDESMLQQIALSTGGSYVRTSTGTMDLENIYKDIRASIEDKELVSGKRKQYEERFQWPLSLALLLLALERLIGEKKRARAAQGWKKFLAMRGGEKLVLFICIASLGLGSDYAKAHPFEPSSGAKAEKAYRNKEYKEALPHILDALVADPHNWQLKYNAGNTFYQLGEYDKAAQLFGELAQNGPQEARSRAFYNLGNTAFRQGKLEDAIKNYEEALKINPKDEDAAANLEFAKKKLHEQKQQQEQHKQQDQQNQQNQDQQQKDQQQQSEQKNQDQQQKDQQQQQQSEQQNQDQQQQSEQQNQDQQQKDQQQQQQQSEEKNQDQQQKDQQQQQKQQEQQGKQDDQKQEKPSEQQQGKQDQEQAEQQKKPEGQENHEQPKQEQPNEDKPQGMGAGGEKQPHEQKMSEEEAIQWLSTMQGDRKEYLQKKFKGMRSKNVEKNW